VLEGMAQMAPRLPLGGVGAHCRKKARTTFRTLFTRVTDRRRALSVRRRVALMARSWYCQVRRGGIAEFFDRIYTSEAATQQRHRRLQRAAVFSGLVLGLGWLEFDRSWLEAQIIPGFDASLGFHVELGPSKSIEFPTVGPYDKRLGYVQMPTMIGHLTERSFSIAEQARMSPQMRTFMDLGGYAVFHEKFQAGLRMRDTSGQMLGGRAYPIRVFRDFSEIPDVLVRTLQFIEDREVLDEEHPSRNPAVDWSRFALAAAGQLGGVFDREWRQGGASTLATQLEKFRHSPDGRTGGIGDKFRQMATATARAYLDGPNTRMAQEQILTSYLNSTPLGSRSGFGEVIGLGDGLFAWYGVDWAEANHYLSLRAPSSAQEAQRRALVYKQALSLLIAQRRPAFYLSAAHDILEDRTDAFLRGLAAAGVIDRQLRDRALGLRLELAPKLPPTPEESFVERKAADAVRRELMGALEVPSLYALDRLDISADTTIDAAVQRRVATVFEQLKNPRGVSALGLVGDHMLGSVDPAKVAWSFVLVERGLDRNRVRIHLDSVDQPFDVNSGAKLMLGSTAKLRTLATYLGIIEQLHREVAGLPRPILRQIAASSEDPLRKWVAAYLNEAPQAVGDARLMLDAAMHRRYPASPAEAFFTGGGVHVFHNFESWEDLENPTVEEAFEHSINLAFIRLMRDVIKHYECGIREASANSGRTENEFRAELLRRFADQEGRVYLRRFDADYFGLSADDALDRLARHAGKTPRSLATVFRSARPDASVRQMRDFLARHLPASAIATDFEKLYDLSAPDKLSLGDRAFVAGVHPLELWLVAYRQHDLIGLLPQVIAASVNERQQAYAWLLRSKNRHLQDVRIVTVLEQDAFDKLQVDWSRQGYPFNHLVPSLATAIGSSGDRADALSNLMGVILNGGLWQPTTDLERVQLAPETPYATQMTYRPPASRRVMSPAVAAMLRHALAGVVAEGTGRNVRGAFVTPNGKPLAIGGKTGTGDNRFETFGAGHELTESRAVDRTATFVFFLGDRFYGTVTAYVAGAQTDQYHFSSALAVSLLRALAPELEPLLNTNEGYWQLHPSEISASGTKRLALAH